MFRGESQGGSKGRKLVKWGRERYGKNSGETKACVSLGYYLVSLRHTRQKPQRQETVWQRLTESVPAQHSMKSKAIPGRGCS